MVHCYSMFDMNIAVDVYSGCVHIMDTPAFKLTEYYAENGFEQNGLSKNAKKACLEIGEEKLKAAYGELKELFDAEQIFTKDCYCDKIADFKKNSVVKALCIHIAHDCNLRCKYCFADEGAYQGKKGLMSLETGKKAIDFVIEKSGARKNIEIDFFGGEPLINFETVKGIVEYAKIKEKEFNKNFRFTITTNGLLLDDEKIKYINENMANIVLSIDGRREINDKMRVRADGSGCYDKILPEFQKIAETRNQDNYYVRGTFTRENLDFSKDVLHLADLGFKQTSVEPVVAPDEMPYSLKEEDLPILYNEYEKLAKEYVKRKKEGNGFNFFHFMIDLNQGPCVIKRLSGCGSGCEYLAVTPEGDIYPCHQFVGNTDFKMGNVYTGEYNEKIMHTFEQSNVYTKEACKNCWAKFYCSGGCPANAWNFNKDLNKPYELGCRLQRKRIECAIAIQAELAE